MKHWKQASNVSVLTAFRLHWCAAGIPGHWGRHGAENCGAWTRSAPMPLCDGVFPCVTDLSTQKEMQPVGQGTEVRLRLQAAAKCTVQLPLPMCGALTWWLSQELGISGRPLSLRTLSFMLSTQGCSRTLEPNGGSYSFTSGKEANTGYLAGLCWCQEWRELAVLWGLGATD